MAKKGVNRQGSWGGGEKKGVGNAGERVERRRKEVDWEG